MSGLLWLKTELELAKMRESWVAKAYELVEEYELAGGEGGGELLKPSQINALAREAAKGRDAALEYVKRQASRGRNKKKWNEKKGDGKPLAERLSEIISETAKKTEGTSKAVIERAPAAFASLLRAAYNIRRSTQARGGGGEARRDEAGAGHGT